MTSTTIATSGCRLKADVRAPANVISSCTTPHAATSPGAPPASATSRAASSAMNEPRRLSIERETTRSLRSSTGSAAITATSPMRTSSRASSPSFAPMSMCMSRSSTTRLRSSSRSMWIALRPQTPGSGPSLREHLDALPGEDLPVPAADADEAQKALVVDVRDDQADLVDVSDDGEERSPFGDVPFTRATTDPMTSVVTSSVNARPASAKTAAGAVS